MRNKCVANYDEILAASYHETGHCLLAEHLGLRVYIVMVSRDGAGFAEFDRIAHPVRDMQLTAAGYVAECMYRGEPISIDQMRQDAAQRKDYSALEYAASDRRVNGKKAVKEAFDFAQSYLEIPSVNRRLHRLAHKLSRTRRLDGHLFRRGQ